jgi:hypothetical protein
VESEPWGRARWSFLWRLRLDLAAVSLTLAGGTTVGVGQAALFSCRCNTPGVTMARTHLDTKGYEHLWKNLRSKSMRALES